VERAAGAGRRVLHRRLLRLPPGPSVVWIDEAGAIDVGKHFIGV
jgi:hypothetical protein